MLPPMAPCPTKSGVQVSHSCPDQVPSQDIILIPSSFTAAQQTCDTVPHKIHMDTYAACDNIELREMSFSIDCGSAHALAARLPAAKRQLPAETLTCEWKAKMPGCLGGQNEGNGKLTDYDCWDKLGRGRPSLDAMELCCMVPNQRR